MTETACAPADGTVLCIIPGPNVELRRESDGVRWCFGCRRHLPHDLVCLGDEGPSYYEPVWTRECSRCKRDRTLFPGREWFW